MAVANTNFKSINSNETGVGSASSMAEGNSAAMSNQHLYGCLANFEIEKQIGQGQFSQVFKAKCLANNKVVALKRMKVRNLK